MFHAALRPSSGSPRRASFPRGKLLYRVGRHTASFLRRDNRKVPGTAQKQPVRTKRNHLPTCHSERTNVSRGIFPSSKFYLVLVLLPTWWIPPLRFAAVGMTYQRVLPFIHTGYICNVAGLSHQKAAPFVLLRRRTHEQIAQHISSAREAVARMLKSFSEDGLVELKRGAITLRETDGLDLLK